MLPQAHRAAVEQFTLPRDTSSFFIQEEIIEESKDGIKKLTEQDYVEVAKELGVEVAAIKAVVEIEAGKAHKGFTAPGKPIVNFDLSMFRRYASKRGVNLSRFRNSHSAVFTSVGNKGLQGAWNRLKTAESINRHAAIEGTFWGMFQIGGFNYKLCGTKSLEEFEMLMSRSERDQLELFAKLLINTGMVKPLQKKDWAAFARRYNGPGYARKGYHTKMAAAYRKHKAQ